MSDLLLQLLEKWIGRQDPPDIISIESPGEAPVIQFIWFFKNKKRQFTYTKERWDIVYDRFNDFWVDEIVRKGKERESS